MAGALPGRLQAVAQRDGAAGRAPPPRRHERRVPEAARPRPLRAHRPPDLRLRRGRAAERPEWYDAIDAGQFAGTTQIIRADETTVTVEWAASTAIATGRRLVLFVALGSGRARRSRVDGPRPDGPRELTPREREVVRLVALGHSGPEVAEELHIAHDTVRTHVRNAMKKVGARSRAHLVAKVLGEGHALA
jgi:DNA-binding CsgD family transcriptional regulator